ncbi:MAG: BlaI/MecI/CopY family transcriptional regulator [Solobacterium sp.]|nr:BlaI/MecI/CopY family transcriptional regulator [Solobacterium sp.]
MKPLSAAELKIAEKIWLNQGISATALYTECEEEYGWKKSTFYTLLKRMREKDLLGDSMTELRMKISESEYEQRKLSGIISQDFHGSLPSFISAYVKENKLSENDRKELIDLLEGLKESES